MKKKDGDAKTSDQIDLLVQKLRWLRLPGMAKLVAAILERAAKENLSATDVGAQSILGQLMDLGN